MIGKKRLFLVSCRSFQRTNNWGRCLSISSFALPMRFVAYAKRRGSAKRRRPSELGFTGHIRTGEVLHVDGDARFQQQLLNFEASQATEITVPVFSETDRALGHAIAAIQLRRRRGTTPSSGCVIDPTAEISSFWGQRIPRNTTVMCQIFAKRTPSPRLFLRAAKQHRIHLLQTPSGEPKLYSSWVETRQTT